MQQNLKEAAATTEPVLEILEDLVPAELHRAAWEVCSAKRWYFGHGSNDSDWGRFWKMDLDGDAIFNAIWDLARPKCEALAGGPLRVLRQYANGHTYGLGGQPHLDDDLPGTFTLLYYPNPEWKDGWDGETVYLDPSGDIAMAVRPRPNRAVFFDSRIPHAGRAPGRQCPALRVTVAYKLRLARPPENNATLRSELAERRNGALRTYRLRVKAAVIEKAVAERLGELSQSVRLPGFRPGKIPAAVLEKRYGARARTEVLNRIVTETTRQVLPKECVLGGFELIKGAESGDVEFDVTATFLPDLAPPDFSEVSLERLTADPEIAQAAGLSSDDAAALLRHHLKVQVLDFLDAAYPMPLMSFLVERELASIWKAAEAQSGIPAAAEEQAQMRSELREIAERRLRLGAVIAELARRNSIDAANSAQLEDKVVDLLVTQATVQDRQASVEELRELAES